jgi:hypothetical protein
MARSRIASAVIEPICPWEGATDLLRELAYQDSVTETAFSTLWWRRLQRAHNRHFAMAENLLEERDRHPFDDGYWASKRPALERIEVPALSRASWSDHGLHTRGSLEGFERIGSARKWLYTHGARLTRRFRADWIGPEVVVHAWRPQVAYVLLTGGAGTATQVFWPFSQTRGKRIRTDAARPVGGSPIAR